MTKKKRLGEILHERGQVSAADLHKALRDQQGKVVHLGELLLQRRLVSKDDLIAALAEVMTMPYVDCSQLQISPEVLQAIPLGDGSAMQHDSDKTGRRQTHDGHGGAAELAGHRRIEV